MNTDFKKNVDYVSFTEKRVKPKDDKNTRGYIQKWRHPPPKCTMKGAENMAGSETIGEFFIRLGLDADDIDKKIKNVVSNISDGLNKLVTGALIPAIAGFASTDFVKQFADEITQVDRLSESLGMSVEQLSAWRTAAEMAGIEADEVGEIFADFNDWMTDVKYDESGTLYDYIQNGILPSVTDANGELKNTEDYILEIADAFHNMDTAEASGIARKLGLSDLRTATWLQQGGASIREDLELAKDIGTYTKEDAAAAREFTMSMTILTQSLKMAALPVFRLLAPIIEGLADKITYFAGKIKNFFSNIKSMGEIGASVSREINKAFNAMANHATVFATVVAGLLSVKLVSAFKSLAIASKTFLFSPWGAFLTALTGIGIVIEDFINWINGGDSKFKGFFEKLFGNADNAKAILTNIYDFFTDVISNIIDTANNLPNIFSNVFESFGKVIDELAPHFENLWNSLTELFSAITSGEGFGLFSDILIAVIGVVVSAIAGLVGFLADNADIIIDVISTVIDVITGIVKVVTFVVDIINTAITSVIVIFTALGNTIQQIGSVIQMIFNAMAGAFNSFVGAVVSGAKAIIDSVGEILSKLAELASNSLLGKILGSVGGVVSIALGGGGNSNVDNRSTVYNVKQTNNITNTAPKLEIPDLVPPTVTAY